MVSDQGHNALTIKPDHSVGADQDSPSCRCPICIANHWEQTISAFDAEVPSTNVKRDIFAMNRDH